MMMLHKITLHAFRKALCLSSFFTLLISSSALAQDRLPEPATTPLAQAQMALDRRDWATAESLLDPLVKAEPKNPFAYFELAQLFENTNRVEAARNIYRAILAIPETEKASYVVIAVRNNKQTLTLLPELAQEKLTLLGNASPASAAATPPAVVAPVSPTPIAATPATTKPSQQATSIESAPPVVAMREWLAAWQNKQVKSYFASYVPDYKGDMANAAAWQKSREQRIASKTKIKINAYDVRVLQQDANQATVSFTQAYVSPTHASTVSKTLVMVNNNGRWLISKETSK